MLHTNFCHLCLSQQTKNLQTMVLDPKVTQISNLNPAGMTVRLTSGQLLRKTLNASPQTALCRCTCRCWAAKSDLFLFFMSAGEKKQQLPSASAATPESPACIRRRPNNNNTMILYCTLPLLQTQQGLCVYSGEACNKVRLWSHRVLAD